MTCSKKKELNSSQAEIQAGVMADVLEIYFALLLLKRKSSSSGNQVSNAGPSLSSCYFILIYLSIQYFERVTRLAIIAILLMDPP